MISWERIDELRSQGLGNTRIARRLQTTPGTIAGMVYRRDHPHVQVPRKPRPPAIYTCSMTARVDAAMLAEIDALAAEQHVPRAALLRDLLEWGLGAARGDRP